MWCFMICQLERFSTVKSSRMNTYESNDRFSDDRVLWWVDRPLVYPVSESENLPRFPRNNHKSESRTTHRRATGNNENAKLDTGSLIVLAQTAVYQNSRGEISAAILFIDCCAARIPLFQQNGMLNHAENIIILHLI